MIKVCCLVVKLPYKFLFIDIMRVFPLKVVFFYVLRRRLCNCFWSTINWNDIF